MLAPLFVRSSSLTGNDSNSELYPVLWCRMLPQFG